jgi:diaminopropionate ammonia-lyase
MKHLTNPHRRNPAAAKATVTAAGFTAERFAAADRSIRARPGYAPTPLVRLQGLAARVGVRGVLVKDERCRFGLRSFKALGGLYSVAELARARLERGAAPADLVVACASAGNHGQGVAAGAQVIGARCTVFLPRGTVAARVRAIAALGAEPIVLDASYDEAVAEAARVSRQRGWMFVPDTSVHGDDEAPRLVMLAYGTLLREVDDELAARGEAPPTHLFVQGGVGGLAGALAAWSTVRWGERGPRVVVVEPQSADCLMQSALRGRATSTHRDLATAMTALACGQASPIAWEVLAPAARDFLTVNDAEVDELVQDLATPAGGDPAIPTSPSGAAGLAPLRALPRDPDLARALGLDSSSTVLAIVTEDALAGPGEIA